MKKVIYKKQTNEIETVYSCDITQHSMLGFIDGYNRKGMIAYGYDNHGNHKYIPVYIACTGKILTTRHDAYYDTSYEAARDNGKSRVFVFDSAKELQEWIVN